MVILLTVSIAAGSLQGFEGGSGDGVVNDRYGDLFPGSVILEVDVSPRFSPTFLLDLWL